MPGPILGVRLFPEKNEALLRVFERTDVIVLQQRSLRFSAQLWLCFFYFLHVKKREVGLLKHLFQKSLVALACLALLFCIAPAAQAATSGKCGASLTWSFNPNQRKLTITGTGAMEDYLGASTPWDSLKGEIVSVALPAGLTSIGSGAFYDCNKLKSITIPGKVTSIGQSAFFNCGALSSLVIGNSVTTIGPMAFYNCYSLTSVTIPNSVTTIGEKAFCECRGLVSVTMGSGVTTIGDNAFYRCLELVSVTMGSGVTTIGNGAFSPCPKLKTVTIPKSVIRIALDAFRYCSALTSIEVEKGNKKYASVDGVLFSYNKKQLLQYPVGNKRTSYTIPDSVTSISEYAFHCCDALTSVTMGSGITTIGQYGFYCCEKLKTVTLGDRVAIIGEAAFAGCKALTPLTLPGSVTTLGKAAFEGCTSLKTVTIPGSVTSFGYGVFGGCTGLTSVTMENGVTAIGESAFYDCARLTSIAIPESVTSIREDAFMSCSGLKTVSLPNGLTAIGNNAFFGCSKLKSVTIPKSVTAIGDMAFYGCTGLTSATILHGKMGSSVFSHCSGLTTVTIGSGVTAIRFMTFAYCTSLTTITIPDTITIIGDEAFYRCEGLKEVYYLGTEAQKAGIDIGPYNEPLMDAAWHCLPTITAQPASLTVAAGETAAFAVTATGADSYRWQYKKPGDTAWTNVSKNGTSATYALTTATRHNGYTYRCRVKNDCGSVCTEPVILTVKDPPVITTQPKALTVYIGKTASFRVAATKATGYQWQYQKPGESIWTNVRKNGTSATYTLTTATRHNGYTYRCRVKNADGTVYSASARLTVSEKPVVTAQPQAVTVTAGANATFTVAVDGAAGYRWQYKKPGDTAWTNVRKNGTSATYTLTAEARHNGYIYRCRITNAKGSTYTKAVTLTVE